MPRAVLYLAACAAHAVIGCASASASDLVYQPINPSFGGNPFNSAHLLVRQHEHRDRGAEREPGQIAQVVRPGDGNGSTATRSGATIMADVNQMTDGHSSIVTQSGYLNTAMVSQ